MTAFQNLVTTECKFFTVIVFVLMVQVPGMVAVSGMVPDMMMAAPMAPVVSTALPQGIAYPQPVADPNIGVPMAQMPQGVTEGYMTAPVQQVPAESDPINLVLRVR